MTQAERCGTPRWNSTGAALALGEGAESSSEPACESRLCHADSLRQQLENRTHIVTQAERRGAAFGVLYFTGAIGAQQMLPASIQPGNFMHRA